MVYSNNGLILSNKKEQIIHRHHYMDDSQAIYVKEAKNKRVYPL
jgi:hypothetical protein